MSSFQADLSAYPVIRIDQIPLVPSNVLRDTIAEVADLIDSMNADDGPKPPLLFYLRRQLEAMHSELANRNANDRINSLLAGVNLGDTGGYDSSRYSSQSEGGKKAGTAPKNDRSVDRNSDRTADRSAIPAATAPKSAPKQLQSHTATDTKTTAKIKENEAPPKLVYKRIPLPSELAHEASLKEPPSRIASKSDDTAAKPSSNRRASSSAPQRKGGKRMKSEREGKEEEEEEDDEDEEGDESAPITSRSEGNIKGGFSSTKTNTNTNTEKEDDTHSMNSNVVTKRIPNNTGRALKEAKRSNSMTNNDPTIGSLTAKAQAALYKDFGSSFLVAGTEKKLRFYPKKVVVEAQEDVRERDRTDRRKAAMKRLLDRREEQQARSTAQRLKKRQDRLEAEETEKNIRTADLSEKYKKGITKDERDESSEEESVSGGEEEENIPIDQEMLRRVECAVEMAGKEGKRGKEGSEYEQVKGISTSKDMGDRLRESSLSGKREGAEDTTAAVGIVSTVSVVAASSSSSVSPKRRVVSATAATSGTAAVRNQSTTVPATAVTAAADSISNNNNSNGSSSSSSSSTSVRKAVSATTTSNNGNNGTTTATSRIKSGTTTLRSASANAGGTKEHSSKEQKEPSAIETSQKATSSIPDKGRGSRTGYEATKRVSAPVPKGGKTPVEGSDKGLGIAGVPKGGRRGVGIGPTEKGTEENKVKGVTVKKEVEGTEVVTVEEGVTRVAATAVDSGRLEVESKCGEDAAGGVDVKVEKIPLTVPQHRVLSPWDLLCAMDDRSRLPIPTHTAQITLTAPFSSSLTASVSAAEAQLKIERDRAIEFEKHFGIRRVDTPVVVIDSIAEKDNDSNVNNASENIEIEVVEKIIKQETIEHIHINEETEGEAKEENEEEDDPRKYSFSIGDIFESIISRNKKLERFNDNVDEDIEEGENENKGDSDDEGGDRNGDKKKTESENGNKDDKKNEKKKENEGGNEDEKRIEVDDDEDDGSDEEDSEEEEEEAGNKGDIHNDEIADDKYNGNIKNDVTSGDNNKDDGGDNNNDNDNDNDNTDDQGTDLGTDEGTGTDEKALIPLYLPPAKPTPPILTAISTSFPTSIAGTSASPSQLSLTSPFMGLMTAETFKSNIDNNNNSDNADTDNTNSISRWPSARVQPDPSTTRDNTPHTSTPHSRPPSGKPPVRTIACTVNVATTSYNTSATNSEKTSNPSSIPTSAKAKRARLTDTYSHIGMIFPIAYSQLGNRQNDGHSARALLESMLFQGKLYAEWMEVMGDYATVFSQDRGLNVLDKNSTSSSVYKGDTRSLHFRVKASVRPEVYNIVSDVFSQSLPEWNELPAGLGLGLSWNLLWTWSKPRLNASHLLVWQRVNHFEGSKELTRKDFLKKNIQRYTDMSGKASEAFEIMPLTYQLPHEYTLFVSAFMEAEQQCGVSGTQNFWIMKPVGLSRGRGIVLVKDIATLTYSQTSVIQKYIEDPLCLDGYKFDLRLYVLVTSFKPLEAFIYTDGFARVSTDKYSLNRADMDNKFIHLTNSSIQKMNEGGVKKDNPLADCAGDSGGTKLSLKGPHGLWSRLQKRGMDVEAIWRSISLVVLKSLVIVDDKMSHQPCSFEVFGYDVLIDTKLRCWLIEVNASPSMARENNLDIRIKNAMIKDTISLVDPIPFDRQAVARVLKKRYSDISKNIFSLGKNDPELEKDLRDILGDFVPRKYGEDPRIMGQYEKLCPDTKLHAHVLKMKAKIIKSD